MPSLLHPALRLLLRRQVSARLRKVKRGARTFKGKLYLAVLVAVFTLWLGPTMLAAFLVPRGDPVLIRPFVTSGLFAFCVVTLIATGAESGIFFTAAEVDFLFPAPFRRRDLLIYRLSGLGLGVLFSAFIFSLFLLSHVGHWFFGFYGIALALAFIQLVPITLNLAISVVGQAAYTRGRKIALGLVGILVAVAAGEALAQRAEGGAIEFVKHFPSTTVGMCLLAPFQVFSRTITAERVFPDFAGWGALALAVDAALITLVLRLDANFLESSIGASQRLYEKLQRMRSGQVWMNWSRPSAIRWRLPMPARWRGAGPVAWRQLTSALRGSRGIVYFLLMMGGGIALPVFFTGNGEPSVMIGVLSGTLPMLSLFLLPQLLQFDFRGDLERIDVLKTLPASASAIAAGELITPVLFATVLELPIVIGLGLFQTEWRFALAAAAAFVPAANLLVFAFENLVFLWYPHRLSNLGAGDFQALARQMLVMFLKFVLLGIGAGLAAGAGGLAYWLSDGSWPATLGAAWCVVTALGLALVPFVADAFRRFDPSVDTAD